MTSEAKSFFLYVKKAFLEAVQKITKYHRVSRRDSVDDLGQESQTQMSFLVSVGHIVV